MSTVVLLGPQRRRRTLAAVAAELGLSGVVATVTAGWQEREAEVEELDAHLAETGLGALNLRLHARAERVFAEDPELAAAHRARQDRLKALQAAYRLHLRHALDGARELLAAAGEEDVVGPQREQAIDDVRRLDNRHLERLRAVHRAYQEAVRPGERPAVARERAEIADALDGCAALAIAGGHVAVLLNRLRLFGLPDLAAGKPLLVWSAGAMTLGERVVLFHDTPPQGPGNAEVLDAGLGRVLELLPLPHAARRLRLDDPARVELFARRFAPAAVTLDPGDRVQLREGRVVAAQGARRLEPGGGLVPLPAEGPAAETATVGAALPRSLGGTPGEGGS